MSLEEGKWSPRSLTSLPGLQQYECVLESSLLICSGVLDSSNDIDDSSSPHDEFGVEPTFKAVEQLHVRSAAWKSHSFMQCSVEMAVLVSSWQGVAGACSSLHKRVLEGQLHSLHTMGGTRVDRRKLSFVLFLSLDSPSHPRRH